MRPRPKAGIHRQGRPVRTIDLPRSEKNRRIPILETFDLPENSTSCARRDCSIVAPQALSLLNSDLMSEAALALAERSGLSTDQQRVTGE